MTIDSQTTAPESNQTAATSPPKTPHKPGWKTTEFWLSIAAKLLGAAFAAGLVGDGTPLFRIAGLVAVVLTGLGYTVNRTLLKTAAMLLVVGLFGGATQAACHGSPGAERAKQIAWSCTSGVRQDLVAAVTPLVESAILAAASADGKLIDDSKLKQMFSGANLLTEAGAVLACAAEKAFANLLSPPAPASGAPASSPLVIDPAELQRARASLRSGWGG